MREKIQILSNKIKEYREKHNLSITAFASLAKISCTSIYKYETGYPYATIRTIKSIAKALGIKEKDLVVNPDDLQPTDITCIDTLGGRIKALRNERNMSQLQLAKKVGIVVDIIYKIEAGITKNSRHIDDIAKALGVNLLELMKGLPIESHANKKKKVEINDTQRVYYANKTAEDNKYAYSNPQTSYDANVVVIGIRSYDGDLLNNIEHKLNLMYPEVEGYLVVRELKNPWSMFVIGRKLYSMTVSKSTIMGAVKYLLGDIEIDSNTLNDMGIVAFGGFDNPIFHIYSNGVDIDAVASGGNSHFIGQHDLNEALCRMRNILDSSVGTNRHQIASYSNKDTIVEIYVSGMSGGINKNIHEAAYRFLDKGVDHNQIVSYIKDIIMINSINKAISVAKYSSNSLENRFKSIARYSSILDTSSGFSELSIVVVDKYNRYNTKKYNFIIL